MVDWLIRLIGCTAIAVGFAAAYLSGRQDARSQSRQETRQRTDQTIPMEHVHGGDRDV